MNGNAQLRGGKAAIRAAVALCLMFLGVAAVLFFDSDNAFLWIKALHIIAVVAWMAGLLYLPRLFIYHLQTERGSQASELFKVMELRLFRIIMNPAMMISWLCGLYLAWDLFSFQGGWLHLKLLFVVLLTGTHIFYGRAMRAFHRDERPGTERFWRVMNEVPALLLIVIVLMVVLKPF
jgi:putative membrane protein